MDRPFYMFQSLIICEKKMARRKDVVPRELMKLIMGYCDFNVGMLLFDDWTTGWVLGFSAATSQWTTTGAQNPLLADNSAMCRMRDGAMIVSGGAELAGIYWSSVQARRIAYYGGEMVQCALPDMNFPRRRHTLTMLRDGTIMATGGRRFKDEAVKNAEFLRPGARAWRSM